MTVDVDRNTTFTVDFNETVLAAPFTLADAIRLTVTPLGSSTPAIVPFTATLNTTGTTLTVLPAAALPIGVASLSWGGFSDAAGNAITGTVAASWNVARSSQLGADFHFRFGSSVAFAANAAGVVHAVQQNDGDGNVQVLRFDGSNFVPFGPPVNERAFGTELALAFERTGVAHVALEQLNAAGTEGEVVVRRYDATLNAWQTLGPAFAMGRPMANSARPRLAVDPANRPVLSFIGSGGAFSLQAHRFDAGARTALGNIANFVFSAQALAIDGTGNPVVAYLQGFGGSNAEALRVARYSGTAWTPLGQLDSVPDATDHLGSPQIAIAADGRPWVAWSKSSLQAVSLAGFDGSAFVALPITPPLETFNGISALTFLNGDPVVASDLSFGTGGVDVRRLRNGAWESPATFATPRAVTLTLIPDANSVLVGETMFSFGQDLGRVSRLAFP